MIGRFLLLIPHDDDGEGALTAVREPMVAFGLVEHVLGRARIFTDCTAPALLHARAGCCLYGPLFRRSDDAAVDSLRTGEAYALAVDRGRHLLRHYWGGYVAVFGDEGLGVSVMRDPSAAMPAYWLRASGFDLVFSDPDLAGRAGIALKGANRDAIAHRLRFPFLRVSATGLRGVSELLPGERITFGEGVTREQLWSPWDHVAWDGAASPQDNALKVQDVVQRCVTAWGSRYGKVQLELSGGLDSSIIAACLSNHGSARAITFATTRAEGDERRFARAVAARSGLPLDEFTFEEATDAFTPSLHGRVNPAGFSVFARTDAALRDAAHAHGVSALMTGGGGDNVFCTVSSAAPVVDAWHLAGMQQAWRTLGDVATLGHASIARALRYALRQHRRWKAGSNGPWPVSDLWLGEGGKIAFQGHPWLEASADAVPGKRAHVAALLRIFPFLDAYDRAFDFPMLMPLLSQPVLETCLAIPTWQWIAGGRDRRVARDAFASDLPSMITARRTKGSLNSTLAPLFDRNRQALRDLLLDGILAREAVIDRSAVAAALDEPTRKDARYTRLFEFADAEIWMRQQGS